MKTLMAIDFQDGEWTQLAIVIGHDQDPRATFEKAQDIIREIIKQTSASQKQFRVRHVRS